MTKLNQILLTATLALSSILSHGQNMNRVPESNPYNDPYKERKYTFVSAGFDVRNALSGGKVLSNGQKRNDQALDLVLRGGAGFELSGIGAFEFGLSLEVFDEINYYSAGFDLNKAFPVTKNLVALIGAEMNVVSRNGLEPLPDNYTLKEYYNPGFSLRGRYETVFATPLFAELQLKYLHRSDIKHIWGNAPSFEDSLNGYLSIGYKF